MIDYFEVTRADDDAQLDRLSRLGEELFIDTFGHLYKPHDLHAFLAKVFSVSALSADLDSGRRLWVAQSQDDWIGYCKMGPCGLPVETRGRALELKQLYVRRDFHGKGVADRLMDIFLQWSVQEHSDELYISCWSENHRALRFYARYGFVEIGAYTFWVGDHADDERILRR